MHIAALDRKAGLSGIHKCSPDRATRSDIDVGVFEHKHGILAAEFQHHRKQALSRNLSDSPARTDASRKDQFVDVALH